MRYQDIGGSASGECDAALAGAGGQYGGEGERVQGVQETGKERMVDTTDQLRCTIYSAGHWNKLTVRGDVWRTDLVWSRSRQADHVGCRCRERPSKDYRIEQLGSFGASGVIRCDVYSNWARHSCSADCDSARIHRQVGLAEPHRPSGCRINTSKISKSSCADTQTPWLSHLGIWPPGRSGRA